MYEKEQLAAIVKMAGLVMAVYYLLMVVPYTVYTIIEFSASSQPKPIAANTARSYGDLTDDVPAPPPAAIQAPTGHTPSFYAPSLFLKYVILIVIGCFLFRRGEKLVIYLYNGIMLDDDAVQKYFDMLLKIVGLFLVIYVLSGIAGLLQLGMWGKALYSVYYAAAGLPVIVLGLYLMKSGKIVKRLAGFRQVIPGECG